MVLDMAKIICLTILALCVAGGSSLKCYTYTCGSRNGFSCSTRTEPTSVTCGIPGKGYQSVCSYVAIDDTKSSGYVVETACDLVAVGDLKTAELKRCVEPEDGEKVVFCNLCNSDLCNTPPRH